MINIEATCDLIDEYEDQTIVPANVLHKIRGAKQSVKETLQDPGQRPLWRKLRKLLQKINSFLDKLKVVISKSVSRSLEGFCEHYELAIQQPTTHYKPKYVMRR